MRAVTLSEFGDVDVLRWETTKDPTVGPGEVLVDVTASAVNRADLLQRQGFYPPPPGASPVLGLECAGEVVEVGKNVLGWKVGELAMALLPGGGYAEEVVVHSGSALHVPDGMTDAEAGAF